MELDSSKTRALDSEDDSETESAVTKSKKSKLTTEESINTDLVDKLQNSVKLDKVKLPKFKDYEWFRNFREIRD